MMATVPQTQEISQNIFKFYKPEEICLSTFAYKCFYHNFVLNWIKKVDMFEKQKNPGVTETHKD